LAGTVVRGGDSLIGARTGDIEDFHTALDYTGKTQKQHRINATQSRLYSNVLIWHTS
jgi:hypothetical protein